MRAEILVVVVFFILFYICLLLDGLQRADDKANPFWLGLALACLCSIYPVIVIWQKLFTAVDTPQKIMTYCLSTEQREDKETDCPSSEQTKDNTTHQDYTLRIDENGRKQGYEYFYNGNRVLISTLFWQDGLLNDKSYQFFSNGRPSNISRWQKGLKHGYEEIRNEDGKLLQLILWEHGQELARSDYGADFMEEGID